MKFLKNFFKCLKYNRHLGTASSPIPLPPWTKELQEEHDRIKKQFTHIACAVGTGGTFSGLIKSSTTKQYLIGFSSLKGAFLSDVIRNFVDNTNWEINDEYHFGGYGSLS